MRLLIGVEEGRSHIGHSRMLKIWRSNMIVTTTPCSHAMLVAGSGCSSDRQIGNIGLKKRVAGLYVRIYELHGFLEDLTPLHVTRGEQG